MPFKVKRRGKLTYYYEGDAPVLSALVVLMLRGCSGPPGAF